MTDLQSIPLNRLVHAKTNVRKTGRDLGIEGLMISIKTHGLRQNLNVRATTGNRFEVVAGGRRLEAMRRLAKQGSLDAATPVPCLLLAKDDNPTEVSFVENAQRLDMHPDDQCAAFAELVTGGMPLEDIAARFGVSDAVVRQRLKLSQVSPRLRKLFRVGDVTLAQMMALALVDDHSAQEKAWADLPDWNRDPQTLRRRLMGEGVPATNRLAVFVTVEAYEAAGGMVLRDLFEEDEPPVLADASLLETLAMAKLEEAGEAVRAEGWSWVKIATQNDYEPYERVFLKARDGEEGMAYDPYDIERAGAKVMLDYDGSLRIDRGLVVRTAKPKEKKGSDADGSPTYSEAVLTDLTAHKTAALRLELSQNPKMALASVVHTLGLGLLYRSFTSTCLDLTGRSVNLESRVQSLDECSAHAALATVVAAWRETLPADPTAFWDWCLAADTEKLGELLAVLVGLSVDAAQGQSMAKQLAEAVTLDIRKHWTPKADGFYARLSKPLMANLLTDAGEHNEAAKVAGMKKGEAAIITAAHLEKAGWLPVALV